MLVFQRWTFSTGRRKGRLNTNVLVSVCALRHKEVCTVGSYPAINTGSLVLTNTSWTNHIFNVVLAATAAAT